MYIQYRATAYLTGTVCVFLCVCVERPPVCRLGGGAKVIYYNRECLLSRAESVSRARSRALLYGYGFLYLLSVETARRVVCGCENGD